MESVATLDIVILAVTSLHFPVGPGAQRVFYFLVGFTASFQCTCSMGTEPGQGGRGGRGGRGGGGGWWQCLRCRDEARHAVVFTT